jgi:hypothetical protein
MPYNPHHFAFSRLSVREIILIVRKKPPHNAFISQFFAFHFAAAFRFFRAAFFVCVSVSPALPCFCTSGKGCFCPRCPLPKTLGKTRNVD